MKIYAVTKVGNEQDIIESLCRYYLQFCDGMIVFENYSCDNTPKILHQLVNEGLNIHIAEEVKAANLPPTEHRPSMIQIAFERFDADMVLLVDADEFLFCAGGDNPRTALEALCPDIEYHIPWITYVYTQIAADNTKLLPNYFPFRRSKEIPQYYKVAVSRKLWTYYGCLLNQGNHFLEYKSEANRAAVAIEQTSSLFYAHYPIRNRFHAMQKCVLMEFNYTSSLDRQPNHGYQYLWGLEKIRQTGTLTDGDTTRFSLRYAVPDDVPDEEMTLVEDPLNTSYAESVLSLRYTDYSANEKDVFRMVVSQTHDIIRKQTENLRAEIQKRKNMEAVFKITSRDINKKYIYYGAGECALEHFVKFSKKYAPLCFCDRAAKDGQTLFDLPVLPPSAIIDTFPDAPIVIMIYDFNKMKVRDYLIQEMGVPAERIVDSEPLSKKNDAINIRFDSMQTRNSEFFQVTIMNQLLMHNSLLCDVFSNFISDLSNISKTRELDIVGFNKSIYYKFLLNQSRLKNVWDILDESSRIVWYHLMLLWVSTFFYAKDLYDNVWGPQGFSDQHHEFFKILKSITGYGELNSKNYGLSTSSDEYACGELLSPGMFVIDGGAYNGDTAELFLKYVGDTGIIYSFEPTEDSYNTMKEKRLPNVQCIQKGLYSRECELKFAVNESITAGSTFRQEAVTYSNNVVTVPVTSIDKFVEDNCVSRIDYIKLDIEGSEIEALKGAYKTIQKYNPNLAICIYHNEGNDVIDVPIWLVSHFSSVYDFKIKHHTKGWHESVIYAQKKP